MMDVQPDAPKRQTFRATRSARAASIAVTLVFSVMLEFLIIMSFVGRHLWNDPRLFSVSLFALPAILWILIVLGGVLGIVRTYRASFDLDEKGVTSDALLASYRAHWDEIEGVYGVKELRRGRSADLLDVGSGPFDEVFIMLKTGVRLGTLNGRFFGYAAQEALMNSAREHGIPVVEIEEITPKELNAKVPGALSFWDLHPGILVVLVVLALIGHHYLTFTIWGF